MLHAKTFGADFYNRANYFEFGPHQRLSTPSKFAIKVSSGDDRQIDLTTMADDEIPQDVLVQGVWTIFPHISIASFYGGGLRGAMISQLFPGKTVGESYTTQFYVMEKKPEDEAAIKAAHDQFDFLEIVVRDEDYKTGKRQHEALTERADDRGAVRPQRAGRAGVPPVGGQAAGGERRGIGGDLRTRAAARGSGE